LLNAIYLVVKPATISKSWKEILLDHKIDDCMDFEEEYISAAKLASIL
jgi:hypothetical protein